MSSSTVKPHNVVEGIFAINKPHSESSAGVLRNLQDHFDPSSVFAPWLAHERQNLLRNNAKPRAIRNLKVKLGHGGTLDPMATGVLVVGVGKGTKCLSRFLECTKSYECVVLFGAATDSYDRMGKVVSRAPYEHITKEKVEEALQKFKGKIMQKPSIFSALKVDGKKMYEYARAGGPVPEVKAREVEVEELEMVEWLEPGTHSYEWPDEEVDSVEKVGAEKLIGVLSADATVPASEEKGTKRERDEEEADDTGISMSKSASKKPKMDEDSFMSGALPVPETPETKDEAKSAGADSAGESSTAQEQPTDSEPKPQPPAARLRMTVTSGFYVRSLCHDLGLELGSRGLMSSLVRTRQGPYELGKNVIEYEDVEKGEDTWGPEITKTLEAFMEQESWEAETVSDEDIQAFKKDLENRKEDHFHNKPNGNRGKFRKNNKNWGRGNHRGGNRSRNKDGQ